MHHRDYQHRGEEYLYLDSLRVLCGQCHKMHHGLATVDEVRMILRRIFSGVIPSDEKVMEAYEFSVAARKYLP